MNRSDSTLFARTFVLVSNMMRLTGQQLFVTLLEADHSGRDVKEIQVGWAGTVKDGSRAGYFGPAKAFELLSVGAIQGITLTPTGAEFGCGFPGGIRNGKYIISGSGQASNADLLIASTLMWGLEYEIRLNKVFLQHQSLEELSRAIAQDEELSGNRASLIGDNVHIILTPTTELPNHKIWKQHQLVFEGSRASVGWEFATIATEEMLRFISSKVGVTPTYHSNSQNNNLIGHVTIGNRDVNWEVSVSDSWKDYGD
jgi:hypothetical protein